MTLRIGGHRGWRARHPENTLEGFAAVIDEVDFVEIDIRWTLDGVAVLAHDPIVGGVTLAEHTATELAGLPGTSHVPRFSDLLERFPGLPLDIELKHQPGDPDFDPTFTRPLAAAAMARAGDVVTSFHWPTLGHIKEAMPRLLTGVLVEPPTPMGQAIEEALTRGHRFVVPERTMIESGQQVEAMHRQGLLVGTWTVNDPAEARRFADYGVDAIVTDDPPVITAEVRP